MSFRLAQKFCRRQLSTSSHGPTSPSTEALDKWISLPKRLSLSDTLSPEHLSDLYITLPTRDGTQKVYQPPRTKGHLGYGHHLVFFHPRNPEPLLCSDGTDGDFSPPEPYTRRMWAGGKIKWNLSKPLIIGEKATTTSNIVSVEKKGFERGNPMVFLNQKIEIRMEGKSEVCVEEERSHVYLTHAPGRSKSVKEVRDLPTSSDFSFKYLPSTTTLFRFSALTFNGHRIHLDKDYAQKSEGYPERLVHGPLTALMLLETLVFHNPTAQLKLFEYRARNPVIVNRPNVIHGTWEASKIARLWCMDDNGVVGMTGRVEVV